ncbi:MAG: hypothetical protein JOY71_06785 [Acetobacteraceae bacterium]|nr:hypothetical protein [Acetobacteraceae bacterium]
MRSTLIAAVAAAILWATAGLAQTTGTPGSGQTQHAVSPESGKAKSTPQTTQVPGSSTTGNATGPAGTSAGNTNTPQSKSARGQSSGGKLHDIGE